MKTTGIGEKLKALRIEKNYSVKNLANLLNVSESTIRQMEYDKRLPGILLLVNMAKLFNVSTDYFIIDIKVKIDKPVNTIIEFKSNKNIQYGEIEVKEGNQIAYQVVLL